MVSVLIPNKMVWPETGYAKKQNLMRIPPPVIMLFCIAVALKLGDWAPLYSVESTLLSPLALLFLVFAVGLNLNALKCFIKAKTTINPIHAEKASVLVVDGVYRLSRNPMYLGMAMAILAIVIWRGHVSALASVVIFIFYMDRFQITFEEKVMEKKFGSDFINYCNKVRRWI